MKASIAILLLGLFMLSAASGETLRSTTSAQVIDDSDDTRQYRYFTGLMASPRATPRQRFGVGVGYHKLEDRAGEDDFRLARFDHEYEPGENTGLHSSLSVLDGAQWSPVLGGTRLTHRFSPKVYGEVSAERDYVDTVTAIENRWDLKSYSASLDYGPLGDWTLVGGYTFQDIGDGNDRDIYVARVIHDFPWWSPLVVEGRSRALRSDFNARGYFSPLELDEHLLQATFRRPVLDGDWFVSARLGAGVQRINSGDTENLFDMEVEWRGWFNDHWGLEANASCRNTVEFFARGAGEGYRYCQAHAAIMRSW